jgi:hypothetical protein
VSKKWQLRDGLIVHGLARPVLYPLLTGWPAVGYNPMLGLCGAYQGLGWIIYHLGLFFEEILNMTTINPALVLHDANQGSESFIYYLGSFFEEILNMMAVKINIAYNMGFFQSGMELEGTNGRTLPNLDDLYAKWHVDYMSEKGIFISGSQPLLRHIWWLLPKMA